MDTFSQLILAISVTSFLGFQWLFHRASPWVSTRISPGFDVLSDKQKVEWNSRNPFQIIIDNSMHPSSLILRNSWTVSTLHALLVGLFCLYILFFDDLVNEDPVWGDPTLVKINVAITTGYLISDLLLIFYYWKAIGDKFFVLHHLAALYAYYYVLGQGTLPYFANFRLLAEFSTPCVNQRWFFEVLGYPRASRSNMANGVAMAAVFFAVRIAVMPVYYGRMCAVYGTAAYYLVPWGGRVAWIGSSICLDIMNVMWMHKIARGCSRVLRAGKQGQQVHGLKPQLPHPPPQENGKKD